jgi:hypothetical protein
MKLDKLHIFKNSSGSKSHGDSIAGGIGWIGRTSVDLSGSPRDQKDSRSQNGFAGSFQFVKHGGSTTPTVLNQQLDPKMIS